MGKYGLKKIISLLLFCIATTACVKDISKHELRSIHAPWDKPTFDVHDGGVMLSLPTDFIQISDHEWVSFNRMISVKIINEPYFGSPYSYLFYASDKICAGEHFIDYFVCPHYLGNGREGRYENYTSSNGRDTVGIQLLDKQVGHIVICKSRPESGDDFKSSCFRITESIKID